MYDVALERTYAATKALAFGAPGIKNIAGWRRALAVERGYAKIVQYYEARPSRCATVEELVLARGGARIQAFRQLTRRPRVLFVGTDYDQDSSGLLSGLEAVADVQPFTRGDGGYGQCRRPGTLRYDDASPNGARVLELLDAAERVGAPFDLLIGQMWHGYIDRRVLSRARERFGALVVNIAMDDRHAFEVRRIGRKIGTRGLAPSLDLAATAAPEAVDWYLKERCPAVFLAEASDPMLFRPRPGLPKRYDVAFVGARYGIRGRIIEKLEKAGIRVEARGSGWPKGRIATTEIPELFAQSRIVLGVGAVGQSRSLVALKLRDFDGPMSGSCYVTQANPDLRLVYDVDQELAVYRDEADAVQVVRALLIDDERRAAIAHAGRIRAERDHTWARRFEELFDVLRGSETVKALPAAREAW